MYEESARVDESSSSRIFGDNATASLSCDNTLKDAVLAVTSCIGFPALLRFLFMTSAAFFFRHWQTNTKKQAMTRNERITADTITVVCSVGPVRCSVMYFLGSVITGTGVVGLAE